MSFFGDLWGGIKDAFNWLKGAVEDAWNWIKDDIGEILGEIFKAIITSELKDEFDLEVGVSGGALTAGPIDNVENTFSMTEQKETVEATSGKDAFLFSDDSTGDYFKGGSDVIKNFDASADTIHLPEGLTYSGNATIAPPEGTYSVSTKSDGSHLVTWKDENGWNDIQVFGDNPLNAIVTDSNDINLVVAGTDTQVLEATDGKDVFTFVSETTGDVFQNKADIVSGFEANEDQIVIPKDMHFAGKTSVPKEGAYSIWEQGDNYVVTWKDDAGFHDIVVEGDDPTGHVLSGFDVLA